MFYFTSLLLPSTSLFFKGYTSAKVTHVVQKPLVIIATVSEHHLISFLTFVLFYMLASFKSQLRTLPVEVFPRAYTCYSLSSSAPGSAQEHCTHSTPQGFLFTLLLSELLGTGAASSLSGFSTLFCT